MSLKRQKQRTTSYAVTCQSGVGLVIFIGAISPTTPAGTFGSRHSAAYRMLYKIHLPPTEETYGIAREFIWKYGLKRIAWLQSFRILLSNSVYLALSAVALLQI